MLVIRVFVPFALGYFLSYLLRVVNAVIAPDLIRDLGLDASDLGLLTSVAFLAFGAFQLPVGILLDRFGPRLTEPALLLVAAGGALLFAVADGLTGLLLGRALIGLGTSACLMAAFKAYVVWFPRERLPVVNGFQMAAGGLGALTGTVPVEAALGLTDWRGLFVVFALLAVLLAGAIFLAVPRRSGQAIEAGLGSQLRGIARVFTSALFWRIAPATFTSQASFLAIQSLWLGPWLIDVGGLPREDVAVRLLGVAAAMVTGFITLGTVTERLGRFGIRPVVVALSGIGGFALIQVVIQLTWPTPPFWIWLLFGFLGSAGILPYAILAQSFPEVLSGRVITGLNLLTFGAAFAAQWAIGAIIDLWPAGPDGGYAPDGYRAAFLVMLGFQLLGLFWFAAYRRARFAAPHRA